MFWLLTTLLMANDVDKQKDEKVIYVAPASISDPALEIYQQYIDSLVISAAGVKSTWVRRETEMDNIVIYDKYSIETAQDTVCNYINPLECAKENLHWVLITEISSVENHAVIKLKLYDENSKLISDTNLSSHSFEPCVPTPDITYNPRDIYGLKQQMLQQEILKNCKMLDLKILNEDIVAAITMLFAKAQDKR